MQALSYGASSTRAHKLAYDEERRVVVAYDRSGALIGELPPVAMAKRQTASCALIDYYAVENLPGFHFLTDEATTSWGADWDRYLTNPPEYPAYPASACVTSSPSPSLTWDASPSCSTSLTNSTSIKAGSDGNVALPYTRGTSSGTQFTVATAASFPVQTTLTSVVNIPSLDSALDSSSPTLTMTNSLLSTTASTASNTEPATLDVTAKAGQSCSLALTTIACSATGSTRVQVSAQGYLWFNYPSTRSGHYKWALSLETYISDITQRSTYLGVNASTHSTGIVKQVPQCAFLDGSANDSATTTSASSAPGSTVTSPPGKAVPVYAYAVPIAVVLGLAIAAVVVLIIRRSRSSRPEGQWKQQVSPMWLPNTAGDHPSSGIIVTTPQSSTIYGTGNRDEKYRHWTDRLDHGYSPVTGSANSGSDFDTSYAAQLSPLPPAYAQAR
ncbi:hypothetical protein EXIGLDRAFT_668444 [Exidia glandulosa HHB12029]|uniref:Transmembrane protein n=1 Tax=Exidia glandulosa HHB12029 TaxID=1314781 RepID=A0A165MN85_EXIGL|nr:hypothetical protein EXIGLDRAFT_668444 [Exidia glandulosa HHB12029]